MPNEPDGKRDEEGINQTNWALNRSRRNHEHLQQFIAEEESGRSMADAFDEELKRENAALQAALEHSRASSAKARASYLHM